LQKHVTSGGFALILCWSFLQIEARPAEMEALPVSGPDRLRHSSSSKSLKRICIIMKRILVIGGTKGIGAAIVQQLRAEGANVIVVSRNIGDIAPADGLQYIQADLSEGFPGTAVLPEVLDGLVYCPGSINLKPFHHMTEADFLADWQLNFMGAVRSIQACLPQLKRAQSASIVLFSTVAVGTGMPFHTSIAAAKGAVEGLARSLAAELAPRVRVNCVAPSLTNTPLAEKLLSTPEKMEAGAKRHPLQRIGQAADIGAMACFLLSDKASWMTGQVLHADGGMSTLKV
jgi:3-oxoacyl-[acyl-carrier protein] reductase